jgi:hypothetical protein
MRLGLGDLVAKETVGNPAIGTPDWTVDLAGRPFMLLPFPGHLVELRLQGHLRPFMLALLLSQLGLKLVYGLTVGRGALKMKQQEVSLPTRPLVEKSPEHPQLVANLCLCLSAKTKIGRQRCIVCGLTLKIVGVKEAVLNEGTCKQNADQLVVLQIFMEEDQRDNFGQESTLAWA